MIILTMRDSPDRPGSKTPSSQCREPDLIPGQGTMLYMPQLKDPAGRIKDRRPCMTQLRPSTVK